MVEKDAHGSHAYIGKLTPGVREILVFLCYRRKDGAWHAAWLYRHLKDAPFLDASGKTCHIRVYYDQTAPGVSDWKKLHFPSLQTSQAMILVCTPGIAADFSRRGQPDWVYEELRWWSGHRDTAPIVVDATGEGDRWLPRLITRKWPDINRIDLNKDDAAAAEGTDVDFALRIRERIIGAIRESEQRTVFEDLQRFKQLTKRLTVTLLCSVLLLLLAVCASVVALNARDAAEKQRRFAEEQQKIAEGQKGITLEAFSQLMYTAITELAKFPGTEKVRESLARATIASLEHSQKLTPEDLVVRRELATSHRLLGSILNEVREFQAAQKEFKESASFYGDLLRKEPKQAFWYRDLAVSLFNSGLMLEQLGDRQGACKEYAESVNYARTAAKLDQQWANLLKDTEDRQKALNCWGEK